MSAALRTGRAPVALTAAGGAVSAVAVALLAWGCSPAPAPRLKIVGAYVPRPASPDVAAAYFTVVNAGGAADELTGVTSDVSARTMMHQSTGGTMRMVRTLAVPAHGRLVFAPGGYHVMLERPAPALRRPGRVRLTLRFRHSSAISVSAPVMPIGYRPSGTTR